MNERDDGSDFSRPGPSALGPIASESRGGTAGTRGPTELKLGISACLLGQNVRFDGGHKRDRFLTETLGRFVTFVPVCPEVESGMPVPRDSLRLVSVDGATRIVTPADGVDHTESMRAWAVTRCAELAELGLSGFVLKKDSPSCGLERVRIYDANTVPSRTARGLFATILLESDPLLPVEEEGRLGDPLLRENFFDRVFGFERMRQFFQTEWKVGDLVRFHSREKLFLLAHQTDGYRELGRLVAAARARDRDELAAEYGAVYMRTLKHKATPGRHANVLEHMLGYFKQLLSAKEKQEMVALIADYRGGLVPLVVPLTLIAHFVRRFEVAYLAEQRYLHPHPKELLIRNHV